MPYQPTGKPPGRPAKPKPEPPKPPKPDVHPAELRIGAPPAHGREGAEGLALGELCRECFPGGWPAGATGLGCKHGGWTRRHEVTVS